jgi:hypothetical protein
LTLNGEQSEMNPVEQDEVKRRILSAIFAAEHAGFSETAVELKVLLREMMRRADANYMLTKSCDSSP